MTAGPQSRDMLQIAAARPTRRAARTSSRSTSRSRCRSSTSSCSSPGRSERNVAAIADEIEDKLLEAGHKRLRREGRQESRWVLLDFGDLVVHVFHEQERVYYGLERLWKDCPVVPDRTARARRPPSDARVRITVRDVVI